MRPRTNNQAVLSRRQAQLRQCAPAETPQVDPAGAPGSGKPLLDTRKILFSHYLPTPDIPVDGPLAFEILVFSYSMVAMLLQLLHLYRYFPKLMSNQNNFYFNVILGASFGYPMATTTTPSTGISLSGIWSTLPASSCPGESSGS